MRSASAAGIFDADQFNTALLLHERADPNHFIAAVDGSFLSIKFISTVTQANFELVGKLRVDANIKWLYEGEYAGAGRPRKHDGKVTIAV